MRWLLVFLLSFLVFQGLAGWHRGGAAHRGSVNGQEKQTGRQGRRKEWDTREGLFEKLQPT